MSLSSHTLVVCGLLLVFLHGCSPLQPAQRTDNWAEVRQVVLREAQHNAPDLGFNNATFMRRPLTAEQHQIIFMFPSATGVMVCTAAENGQVRKEERICERSQVATTAQERTHTLRLFQQADVDPEAAIRTAQTAAATFLDQHQGQIDVSGTLRPLTLEWQTTYETAADIVWDIRFNVTYSENQVVLDAKTGQVLFTNSIEYKQ